MEQFVSEVKIAAPLDFVPIYEDLQAYIRNSAVFNIQNMTVPLLLEVGNNDGTVFWHQGVEMYNIARRAKKK